VNICWLCWYFRFPMISIVDVLAGALEHFLWLSIQLGISSSQVSFISFRGGGWNHQPDDY
jgi:disulfide bond formation protein DsbB